MENENIDIPRIKVTRKRKRLYEDFPGDVPPVSKPVTVALGKKTKKKKRYNFKHDEARQIIASYTALLPVVVYYLSLSWIWWRFKPSSSK